MPPTPRLSTAQKLVLQYYKAKINLMHVVNARWAAGAALDLFTKPYTNLRRKDPPIWKKAKRIFLTTGAGKMAGYQWGPAAPNGKKLLIIHGFAGSCKSFDRYIAAALKAGFEVIAYDAPAHGRSEGRRLNVVMYRWMIEEVIRHHGMFDACLAHSIGGMSLLLALEDMDIRQELRIALIAPLTEASRAADNFFEFLQLPIALRHAFEAELQSLGGHPLSWYSLNRMAPQFPKSMLWVHDEEDDTTPFADVQKLMSLAPPNVEFKVTKGLGHTRIYRDNEVFKAVMAFWQNG
jgi:pimeloyl-ACP methyl ester carboxylesterase